MGKIVERATNAQAHFRFIEEQIRVSALLEPCYYLAAASAACS